MVVSSMKTVLLVAICLILEITAKSPMQETKNTVVQMSSGLPSSEDSSHWSTDTLACGDFMVERDKIKSNRQLVFRKRPVPRDEKENATRSYARAAPASLTGLSLVKRAGENEASKEWKNVAGKLRAQWNRLPRDMPFEEKKRNCAEIIKNAKDFLASERGKSVSTYSTNILMKIQAGIDPVLSAAVPGPPGMADQKAKLREAEALPNSEGWRVRAIAEDYSAWFESEAREIGRDYIGTQRNKRLDYLLEPALVMIRFHRKLLACEQASHLSSKEFLKFKQDFEAQYPGRDLETEAVAMDIKTDTAEGSKGARSRSRSGSRSGSRSRSRSGSRSRSRSSSQASSQYEDRAKSKGTRFASTAEGRGGLRAVLPQKRPHGLGPGWLEASALLQKCLKDNLSKLLQQRREACAPEIRRCEAVLPVHFKRTGPLPSKERPHDWDYLSAGIVEHEDMDAIGKLRRWNRDMEIQKTEDANLISREWAQKSWTFHMGWERQKAKAKAKAPAQAKPDLREAVDQEMAYAMRIAWYRNIKLQKGSRSVKIPPALEEYVTAFNEFYPDKNFYVEAEKSKAGPLPDEQQQQQQQQQEQQQQEEAPRSQVGGN